MITITLEVTPAEMLQIAKVLDTSPPSHEGFSHTDQVKEVQTPPKPISKAPEPSKPLVPNAPKPGGKKAARMPAFGRSQEQINEFINHEQSRVAKLDESALLRQQREEEKAAQEAAEEEVARKAMKAINATPEVKPMPAKLWSL